MTIEIKCPRCGTTLKAADRKAGKRGRCPVCGGAVKVPNVKPRPAPVWEMPPMAHAGGRMIWTAAAVVLVLIVLCAVLALGHHARSPLDVKAGPKVLTPEAQEKLRRALVQFTGIESEIEKYQQDRLLERHLRARDVLAKSNHYEPVGDYERELRRQGLEEQAKAARPEDESGLPQDEWRLNTPLAPSEQPELARLSEDLQQQAAKLKNDLGGVGVIVTLSDDPLGRALLDGDEAAAKLAARKERLRQEAFESSD